jgi:hypothetical protein
MSGRLGRPAPGPASPASRNGCRGAPARLRLRGKAPPRNIPATTAVRSPDAAGMNLACRPELRPAIGDGLPSHSPARASQIHPRRRLYRRPAARFGVSGVLPPESDIHPSNAGRERACWPVSGVLSMTPAFAVHPGHGSLDGLGIPAWLTFLMIFNFSTPEIRRLPGSLCCGSVAHGSHREREGAAAWQSHSRPDRSGP